MKTFAALIITIGIVLQSGVASAAPLFYSSQNPTDYVHLNLYDYGDLGIIHQDYHLGENGFFNVLLLPESDAFVMTGYFPDFGTAHVEPSPGTEEFPEWVNGAVTFVFLYTISFSEFGENPDGSRTTGVPPVAGALSIDGEAFILGGGFGASPLRSFDSHLRIGPDLETLFITLSVVGFPAEQPGAIAEIFWAGELTRVPEPATALLICVATLALFTCGFAPKTSVPGRGRRRFNQPLCVLAVLATI